MTLPVSIVAKPEIDISHHRIHEGNHFIVHRATTVLAGAIKYFLIIPPPVQPDGSIIEMHVIFEIYSNVAAMLEFFESPTIAANGIPLDIINNNRRSGTTSLCQVFEDPAVTADGTMLFQERKGTGLVGPVELGEFERNDEEIILHQDDNYILKFTPTAGAAADITMELNWYDNRPSSPIPVP